jgi:hypothetical protein
MDINYGTMKTDIASLLVGFVLFYGPFTIVVCCGVMYSFKAERNLQTKCLGNNPLCGLVVRVPGYGSRGPGSIPDAAKFSEK